MKYVILICLFSTPFLTAAETRGPARVGEWIPGRAVPRRPHPDLRVDVVKLVQPTGLEDVPPPSSLELTVRNLRTERTSTYVITPEMAYPRGFSLDGLRFRLLADGYRSQINLRVDGGRLVDFTLDIDCDQYLSTRD